MLLLASLAVAVLPFRQLTRTIGSGRTAESDTGSNIDEIVQAIERAERRLPVRIVCIHKSLVAHWMLRRRGIASLVHYGIRPDIDTLQAHVWVEADGRIVMGADESTSFARVATFPATRAKS